jgi:hypothetical protein
MKDFTAVKTLPARCSNKIKISDHETNDHENDQKLLTSRAHHIRAESDAEKSLAGEYASDVKGVKRVTNDIKVVEKAAASSDNGHSVGT